MAQWRLMGFPQGMYVNIGTAPADKEMAVIGLHSQRWPEAQCYIRECKMNEVELGNGYVPYRNAILVLLAGQADRVVAVSQIAEWAPDKNKRFWSKMTKLMTQASNGSTQGVMGDPKVIAPFAHMTKADLLLEYKNKFGAGELHWLLRHTWSCYRNGEIHCGQCSGCRQRLTAEVNVGYLVTQYEHPSVSPINPGDWLDAARWVRDNRGVKGLVKRALEAQRARNATEFPDG